MQVIGKSGQLTVWAAFEKKSEEARRIREALDAAEKGVGVVAEKWLPGVAALTGIFSISTAVVAGGSTSKLSTPVSAVTFALLALAIIGATTALVLGYRAAYGWPRMLRFANPAEQSTADAKIRRWKSNRPRLLKWAVGLAGSVILSLLVALGIVWFKPGTASAMTTVRITYHPAGLVGSTVQRCGELLGSGPGEIRVSFPAVAGSEILSVPMTSVLELEPSACEGI